MGEDMASRELSPATFRGDQCRCAPWQPIGTAPKDGTYIVGRIKDYSPVVLSWRAYTWGAAGEHRWRDCKGQIYRPVAWSMVPSLEGGWSERDDPTTAEATHSQAGTTDRQTQLVSSPRQKRALMNLSDEALERAAQAAYEAFGANAIGFILPGWARETEQAKGVARAQVKAVLAALSSEAPPISPSEASASALATDEQDNPTNTPRKSEED